MMRSSARQRAATYRAGSVLLGVVACVAFLSACTTVLIGDGVSHSVAHDREIVADFARAAAFVEGFRAREGRLPSPEAFAAWAASPSVQADGVELATDRFPEEGADALGEPPNGAYVLMCWRGEWMECHAGWSGESTVPTGRADYFMTGSAGLDVLVFALLGVAASAGARRAWLSEP